MVVTYTTSDKVGNILGFPNGYFAAGTTPTSTIIENYINRAEDMIDFATGHGWREKIVTEEYLDPSSDYRYGTGISFNLLNRSIRSIDNLYVWNGSSWEDWIATKTEGRDKDYWIDKKNGVVYLVTLLSIFPRGVYTNYKFGETTVPGGIEEATTLMCAIDILNSPEFSTVVFTEAGIGTTRHVDRINKWQDKVNSILLNYSEFKLI